MRADRWALRLALTTLGRVLSQLGRHDEAVTVHEEALELTRANHRGAILNLLVAGV